MLLDHMVIDWLTAFQKAYKIGSVIVILVFIFRPQ